MKNSDSNTRELHWHTALLVLTTTFLPIVLLALWHLSSMLSEMGSNYKGVASSITEIKTDVKALATTVNEIEKKLVAVTINHDVLRKTVEDHHDEN